MENMIVKIVLFSLLFFTLTWAGNISIEIDKLNQRIPYASKAETKVILHKLENFYISSVVSGKNTHIAKSLRGIIRCQQLLGLDSKTYQKELDALSNSPTKKTKKQTVKKPPKPISNTKKSTSAQKALSIRSIQEKDNNLIVKFNKPITEKEIFYFNIKNKEGYKNIYDLKANLNFKTPKLQFDGLKKLTIAQNRKDKVRIVFLDESKIHTKAFIRKGTLFIAVNALNARGDKKSKTTPKPVVLPVKKISKTKVFKEKTPQSSTKAIYASSKTIVIDAGHGGHDSGAVGYKKFQEKKAVLKVAKLLKRLLESKGYKVHMTRDSDRFIKLTKRTHLANKQEADLFISIHANAAPKGKYLSLKGIETFFLSPAKTAKAKRIAAKENAAASAMNKKSKETLLSFLNTNKIIQSNKLAIDIQSNMLTSTRKKFNNVKDGGVREAPFWVLVGAQMPAVLVELGYITNPKEAERLFNPFYQKALAQGIYNGINNYFANNK